MKCILKKKGAIKMDIFLGRDPNVRSEYCDFYKSDEYVYIKVRNENSLLKKSKIDFAYTGNIPHEISRTLCERGFASAELIFWDLSEVDVSQINVSDISRFILLSAVFKSVPNRKKELFLIVGDEQLRGFLNMEFRKEKMSAVMGISAFAIPPLNEGENDLVAIKSKARPRILIQSGEAESSEVETQVNGAFSKTQIFTFKSA